MTTQSPFAGLLALKEQQDKEARQAQQIEETRRAELDRLFLDIRFKWLCRTLDELGISYVKPEEPADNIVIDGIRFAISVRGSSLVSDKVNKRSDIYNCKAEELLECEYGKSDFDLKLTHLALQSLREQEKYDHKFQVALNGYWMGMTILPSKMSAAVDMVAKAILDLRQLAEQVPALIGEAEDREKKYQERVAAAEAMREAEARKEAEARERWEAEQKQREEAYAKARAEREAKERALRAEVAAKFGVSVDAFDYLIEALANEISRRANEQLSYSFEL